MVPIVEPPTLGSRIEDAEPGRTLGDTLTDSRAMVDQRALEGSELLYDACAGCNSSL